MIWIDQLRAMGVTPVIGNEFLPIANDDLERLERTIGHMFPSEYREFLLQFGACDLEEYAVFPTEGGGIAPGAFFGRDLPSAIGDFEERLPRLVVPINDDGAGNLICLSLRPDSFGAIYFQSHSNGWNEMADESDAAKFATLFRITDSFAEFIGGLVAE